MKEYLATSTYKASCRMIPCLHTQKITPDTRRHRHLFKSHGETLSSQWDMIFRFLGLESIRTLLFESIDLSCTDSHNTTLIRLYM